MDKTNALSLRGDGTFRNGPTLTYLIDDEFTDTRAAGSVHGTAATPGPGTRTVTDTDSDGVSIGSGFLAFANPNSTDGDPGIWYGAQSRAAGLTVVTKATHGTSGLLRPVLWDDDASGIGVHDINFNALELRVLTGAANPVVGAVAYSTAYRMAVVQRGAGAFYFIKGGTFTNWTLIWVDGAEATASLYPGAYTYSATATLDYLRAIQLPAPFDSDDGIATDTKSGSVAVETTFSHTADMLLEFTVTTVASSGDITVIFRKQDATNYWYASVTSIGTLRLYEVVAGTPTLRSNAATVVSSGHRVVVIADGTTITGYSNNVLRWTYSSASNFATATAGEVLALGTDGVVSDLTTYPYGGSLALATYSWPVSVPAGTTFTHEADCLIEFTVTTLPSSGNIRVRFRHQDSSNFWYVLISSGGNFALYEIVEGGSTNRAVTVGSVANGHRVVIVADGTTIKGYSNNTLFWTYSNAELFQTATAGEMNSLDTGGAVSDLKTWPRTLSGIAASVLNKASA